MHNMTEQIPPIPAGRPVVLVMARLPELGRVKTRLARSIGEAAALRLHAAFLADSLALASTAARSLQGMAILAYAGDGLPGDHGLNGMACFAQCTGDLGQRQAHAQDLLFRQGAGAVITIGSDSPTMPVQHIRTAWQDRSRADVLVVPAADGGYILLSQTRPLPCLYQQVPWGTAGVLAAVTARATENELTVHRLGPWHDIDDLDDLRRLQRELALTPEAAPQAARVLQDLRLGSAA
jgi:rSAM/selenodomain-associated transferase 1